jgi:hypothetical protein
MKYFVRLALCIITLLVAQPGNARPVEAISTYPLTLPDEVFRTKFTHTALLPDHLAYLSLMQKTGIDRSTDALATTLKEVIQHMDLTSEAASQFVDNLQNNYEHLTLSNRNATRSLLCELEATQDQSATYARLDQLDDIKDATAVHQYQQAITNLTSAQALALNEWLTQLKPHTSHYTLNHAKIFNHTQQSVELVVDTACLFLASNHFNKSTSD